MKTFLLITIIILSGETFVNAQRVPTYPNYGTNCNTYCATPNSCSTQCY